MSVYWACVYYRAMFENWLFKVFSLPGKHRQFWPVGRHRRKSF